MNNKGFTLIELLGVVVLLSIFMLIAVPNVTSTLKKTKIDSYIADAKKFVSYAEYGLRLGTLPKPGEYTFDNYNGVVRIEDPDGNECILVRIEQIMTDDLKVDINDNNYDLHNSHILISRSNGFIEFHIQLLSKNGKKDKKGKDRYSGIVWINSELLDSPKRYDYYIDDMDLPTHVEFRGVRVL